MPTSRLLTNVSVIDSCAADQLIYKLEECCLNHFTSKSCLIREAFNRYITILCQTWLWRRVALFINRGKTVALSVNRKTNQLKCTKFTWEVKDLEQGSIPDQRWFRRHHTSTCVGYSYNHWKVSDIQKQPDWQQLTFALYGLVWAAFILWLSESSAIIVWDSVAWLYGYTQVRWNFMYTSN